jgi:hypothetical protein
MIPAARSGIVSSIILGMGRAIGETMAMIMILGNAVQMPHSLLDSTRTLTTNIGIEMGYATGDHRQALLAPSWKYVLNYETEWMNRDQIVAATYEAGRRLNQIKAEYGVVPGLVTILVGEDPASVSYVTTKIKHANRLGFKEVQDNQPKDISEEKLLGLIDKYNKDDSIHGILVQLPLPKHINEPFGQICPYFPCKVFCLQRPASMCSNVM